MGWYELLQQYLYFVYAAFIGVAGLAFGLTLTLGDVFILTIVIAATTFVAPFLELPLNDEPRFHWLPALLLCSGLALSALIMSQARLLLTSIN
jgi:hypothetical protein